MCKFRIITPSANMLPHLKRCVASVSDQVEHSAVNPESAPSPLGELEVQHYIQDAASSDGTPEYLQCAVREEDRYKLSFGSEPDDGMYAALNRGLHRMLDETDGEYFAHLNCDEQYLPGTLVAVARFFKEHPEVDILFGDVLIVRPNGELICTRRVVPPNPYHTRLCHNSTFTAATFFRRRVLTDYNLFFDPDWKDLGDTEWSLRGMAKGLRSGILRRYLATFAETGCNRSLNANAEIEQRRLAASAPLLLRLLKGWFPVWYRLKKLCHGCYLRRSVSYAMFRDDDNLESRTQFHVARPQTVWRSRSRDGESL